MTFVSAALNKPYKGKQPTEPKEYPLQMFYSWIYLTLNKPSIKEVNGTQRTIFGIQSQWLPAQDSIKFCFTYLVLEDTNTVYDSVDLQLHGRMSTTHNNTEQGLKSVR